MGCVYLIFVYPSKYHNCNCILTSDLKPFIILRSRLLNYVFRRFLRVIIDMYQGLRICFLMCVNMISLIPWYSLWMSRTSFIFKAIMYARKAHRNFYHFFKPLHICLPALLHLYLSYWCCQDWLTHFSQEHLEICCYTQRIILIGYHIFMCINFLLTCLLRGMTAIFCVFFAIMPPYTRDRLFNKYIFLFFSDKVSLPRGEPDIVF